MISTLEKKSNEEFRQYLDDLSEKQLLQKITQQFTDKSGSEFTALTYLIQTSKIKEANEKFEYSLKKLNKIQGFDLAQYLNSYTVGKNVMKDTSLYLLAILYQKPCIMQSLYEYGTNPNSTMLNDKNMLLDGDTLSVAVSTSINKSVLEKHNELKAIYLATKLSDNLNDKPFQNKIKI